MSVEYIDRRGSPTTVKITVEKEGYKGSQGYTITYHTVNVEFEYIKNMAEDLIEKLKGLEMVNKFDQS